MENPSSGKVTINNPADIAIIVGYFVMVIGVGIWVSETNYQEVLMTE